MAETGWPLIPRGALPAPVPAATRAQRRAAAHVDGVRQLSIFGAETTEPSPADLAGLLAGPGRLGRMGGTARVSVRVDAAWRVHVLVSELVMRGLVVSWLPISEPEDPPAEQDVVDKEKAPAELVAEVDPERFDEDQSEDQSAEEQDPEAEVRHTPSDETFLADRHTGERGAGLGPGVAFYEVRTAYSSRLNGLATAWPTAAARLFLSGPRLRLWVAAAGEPRPGGFALGLDPDKDVKTVNAALVRAGLAGVVSDDGLHYVISGAKRLARLAELVGERPAAAPQALWPGVAAA
jgi:hypothetical protein